MEDMHTPTKYLVKMQVHTQDIVVEVVSIKMNNHASTQGHNLPSVLQVLNIQTKNPVTVQCAQPDPQHVQTAYQPPTKSA
jgi:hypothetical protein